ncbi:T6SS immunity protein Tli4 family protein [Massilia phosphatilytica]
MKKHASLSFAVAAALCVGLNACMATPNHSELSIMSKNNVNTASLATISTFCMGRFLIDVPAGSKTTGGNYKYDFLEIEPVKSMAFAEFEKAVAERESDLKFAKNERTKQSMLLQYVQPDKNTRIFASWKSDASTAQVKIIGYRWINGSRFIFEDRVDDDKQKIGVSNMEEVLSKLRTRTEAEIPNDPGYCFAGGFIANAKWKNEEAGVDFRVVDHPDTIVSVWFYPLSSYKHDKPLLERMGGMTQLLGNLATSVHVLRKGDRKVGPYKGQEHLASAPSSGGMRGHAFVWETQGDGTRIPLQLRSNYRQVIRISRVTHKNKPYGRAGHETMGRHPQQLPPASYQRLGKNE